MKIAILGLSVTSSWGNGHATNYRALMRALTEAGDEVTFLEREAPWYAAHRDLPRPPWGRTILYDSLSELGAHAGTIRDADLVIIGSYVPDGIAVAESVLRRASGMVAFYDIDTPVTLAQLRARECEYLSTELAAHFDLYLSFTGGPALEILSDLGVRRPEAFFCFVDERAYAPVAGPERWMVSYLGTYSAGRQPALEELLCAPARARRGERFVVAGPMYPETTAWPRNVERIDHVPPGEHPAFYCASGFTLNVTRPEMRELGYSPSVRLFEAAACGTAIISDCWPGLDEVFEPGSEILVADSCGDVLAMLERVGPDERRMLGEAARTRVLAEHTARRRVEQLHALVCSETPYRSAV